MRTSAKKLAANTACCLPKEVFGHCRGPGPICKTSSWMRQIELCRARLVRQHHLEDASRIRLLNDLQIQPLFLGAKVHLRGQPGRACGRHRIEFGARFLERKLVYAGNQSLVALKDALELFL